MKEQIFALDIGTRSVVGIILEKEELSFKVVDLVSHEHEERSMLDGQIHDILAVSNVITAVKQKLEDKHGPLQKVCVAAAGRALATKKVKAAHNIQNHPLLEHEDILHMELSAVQKAQYELASVSDASKSTDYYCVGYSVLHYHIDGQIIGSLIEQQGREAEVEIIATFLPKVVVESLIAALTHAQLEMEALTLEPIAAIQVLIPPSMRRLNVALVDIGAGTSDIAITDAGTIVGYGMVPIAGDEITEAISDEYLLDFNEAENVKKEISLHESATFTDILGFESKVTSTELVEKIERSIQHLSASIADEIQALNQKTPKAVMLVGGGSQTPDLANKLAEKLNLPYNRVAIRGINAVQGLVDSEELHGGPEYVTPIGIAIASKQSPIQYKSVTVNNRTIRLFDIKKLTIGDCLLSAGIDFSKLYGEPGPAYSITINRRKVPVEGAYGGAPKLLLNDKPARLETPVEEGAHIAVKKGEKGGPPQVTVSDVIGDFKPLPLTYNGEEYSFNQPTVFVNNNLSSGKEQVRDYDQIEYFALETISDVKKVLVQLDKWVEPVKTSHEITVNGNPVPLIEKSSPLMINGETAHLNSVIKSFDNIQTPSKQSIPLRSLLEQLGESLYQSIDIFFNGKPFTLQKERLKVIRDEETLSEQSLIYSDDQLKVTKKDEQSFIFQDIFNVAAIDLSSVPKKYMLYRNREKASFYTPIYTGDELSIGTTQEEVLDVFSQ
ncbi:pilus assembly protein PilM [Halobacillus salinarum]|uniref:Pilus assembly protein PilM n=1 Tax=Halobacillus salinarum TaxID=2932257 RepID=A0ABY4EPV9_9BACI|nr:pilus assembly protein PilM [Halobacillus salinarum]UOQ46126.1 pilus assembly protein PilM [Halobacillus salinarum]